MALWSLIVLYPTLSRSDCSLKHLSRKASPQVLSTERGRLLWTACGHKRGGSPEDIRAGALGMIRSVKFTAQSQTDDVQTLQVQERER